MNKYLIVVFGAIIIGLTLFGLYDYDGQIVIEWLGYHIESSLIFLCILSVLFIISLYKIINIFVFFKSLPSNFIGSIREKRTKKLITILTESFTIIFSQDANKAKSYSKKLQSYAEDKYLSSVVPVINIFKLQLDSFFEDDNQLYKSYKQMLDYPETKLVAIKGLIEINISQKKFTEAKIYADEASANGIKGYWLFKLYLEIYFNLNEWEEALRILKKVESFNLEKQCWYIKYYQKIYLSLVNQLFKEGDIENAVIQLDKLLKITPDYIDALKKSVELKVKINKNVSAQKNIEKALSFSPSVELFTLYIKACEGENYNKVVKKLNSLKEIYKDHYASYFIMADYLYNNGDLKKARDIMNEALQQFQPNNRLLLLMAKIESKVSSDWKVVNKLLERVSFESH